jgi:glycosyltransferase involved in cell wall biosynthesis
MLKRCLESIPRGLANVVVVDDASNAQRGLTSEDVCRGFSGVTYVKNLERRGACFSRNLGAAGALGHWLCFLDDDDRLDSSYIDAMSELIAAQPHVSAWIPDVIGAKARRLMPVPDVDLQVTNRVGGASGFFIKKTFFYESGGFDENFPSMQDWDLWLRLISRKALYYSGVSGVFYERNSNQKITHNLGAKYHGLRRLYFKHLNFWKPSVCRQHLVRLWVLRQLLEPSGPRFFKCLRRSLCWPKAFAYYLKWRRFLRNVEVL